MGYKADSDFSINKSANGIIYQFANGDRTEIYVENGVVVSKFFSAKNYENNYVVVDYNITLEKFNELYDFSHNDYNETDKKDNDYFESKLSIHTMENCLELSTNFSEEKFFEKKNKNARGNYNPRNMRNARKIMHACLTPTQKRRYIAHYKHNKSSHTIAQEEGVDQKAVLRSIKYAEKKIKKFL